ncbi:GNAT family N-acetyltransferase [Thalassolituus hydrocarboniclasticus]|uniref:N-acetyltransferase n=1 Tax=Thalassolituus hydrocarboniclasticus TaxID=2742796 RepID=A0ABY6A6X1_9GAMM|nr:GNAT family N-acetyltransferase [Thalassolituus hydrocarboniclasticus]UXD86746.1 N-acetyltransferase [Thalassolituus hydrocarboniclasticus]
MVIHQAEQQRFVIEQDGHECVLDYVVEGKQIDFTHTYVPFRLRGKGLAEELVKEGLAWAKGQDYDIQASCWYVRKFL